MSNTHLIVDDKVKSFVPSVLIDYLFNLAKNEQSTRQMFMLSMEVLGKDIVQNITQCCSDTSHYERHQVFGFDPIMCNLFIEKNHGEYHLQCA